MKFEDLLNEIYGCLKDEHYFAALSLSLSIPDICGKVEYPNVNGTAKRYKDWYKTYIGKNESPLNEYYNCEDYSWIDEDIAYSVRCNMFHEGFPKVNTTQVKREINKADTFYLMLNKSNVFSSSNTDLIPTENGWEAKKKTMICVPYLCRLLVGAGYLYYQNNKDKFSIDNSMEEYYSTGSLCITFIK